ncbi:MAG TPA: tRNA pseudouridine(55) synthase TruB, partial [Turneriella sp.]|nr:tRNA pseudouridine(55) synthase TruB [Turneriella sp.]
VKIDGQRAHRAVRKGETPVLKPRRVFVESLTLQKMSGGTLSMHCTVSSGTYIRSLARDIAAALGTCGYLTALRRVAIGNFRLGDIAPEHPVGFLSQTLSDFDALYFFECLNLTPEESRKFLTGIRVRTTATDGIYRLQNGQVFLGLGRAEANLLRVEKVYPTG